MNEETETQKDINGKERNDLNVHSYVAGKLGFDYLTSKPRALRVSIPSSLKQAKYPFSC